MPAAKAKNARQSLLPRARASPRAAYSWTLRRQEPNRPVSARQALVAVDDVLSRSDDEVAATNVRDTSLDRRHKNWRAYVDAPGELRVAVAPT